MEGRHSCRLDRRVYDPGWAFVMSARPPRNNSIGSLSFSLVGIVGVLAVVIAGATIWLVLTDPVTVAESVDAGEVSPLIRSLAGAIFDALRGLLKYL